MNRSIPSTLLVFVYFFGVSYGIAQSNIQFTFSGIEIIEHDWICPNCADTEIGGLSGITTSKQENEYLLVADKPPARFYITYLDPEQGIEPMFRSTVFLSPKKGEMEALRLRPNSSDLFVTDERNDESFVWQYSKMHVNDQKQISLPERYEDQEDNGGMEGLCFSLDGEKMYLGLENPLKEDQACMTSDSAQGITRILEINVDNPDQQAIEYGYPIQNLNHIAKNKNGISDIEYWSQDTLLILERTYFRSLNKNGVKIFLVDLKNASNISDIAVCDLNPTQLLLQPQLLFDFDHPIQSKKLEKVDNVEGMTLSHDRKNLVLVTDNNFRSSQQTQIIVLDVKIITD